MKIQLYLLSLSLVAFSLLLLFFIYLEQGISVAFILISILYIVINVVGINKLVRIK